MTAKFTLSAFIRHSERSEESPPFAERKGVRRMLRAVEP